MPNLVGTGLNQVPTNSMLGGLAYQSPDHASIKDLDLKNLSQINSEIVDTAVDVFIYDTSKDSDGGAWRKRTQHTSWYNETLGTTTRGTRREFPAVAVIVAEQNFIKIYDGDDPNLPMWMVFTSGDAPSYTGPHLNIAGGSRLSAVAALNGEIAVSCNGGLYPFGSVQINFLKDRSLIRPDVGGKESITGIAKRNETGSYTTTYPYTELVNKFANDVAMTVLPNAPIDDATGLPIPTIAVATNGGVSVIRDDGTVVDLTRSSGSQNTSYVDFNGDELIIQNSATTGTYYNVAIPSSDTAHDNYNGNVFWGGGTPASRLQYGASEILSKKSYELVRSYNVGFDILRDYNLTTNGLVAYISSSYNTGWLHGSVKGAFLSDTDTTNVTGTELVTNGTFDSNVSGWTTVTSTITYNSGAANIARNGGSGANAIYQDISGLTIGEKYLITIRVLALSNIVSVYFDPDGSDPLVEPITANATGTYTAIYTATQTSGRFSINATGNSTATATVDDISMRVAEEDRSVNAKGLQVFGTITKSAVATGAELVAYSGWSASNYLEQPYNSDLNYGTGDFYFGGWFKGAGYSDSLIGRLHDSSSAGKGFLLSVSSSGGGGLLVFAIYTLGFQSSGRTTILTTTNETGKGWQQVWGIRRGGTMELWLNGNLVTTASNSDDISDTTYNPPLFIGVQHGSAAFDGELALMRTGASAPSAEQIKKIYEDEKFLFQENAKATLYGSSDAVTALVYDDSSNILHVGTSSGRSEFQGLCRINNTTTAVTTAISASNGLVAEQ